MSSSCINSLGVLELIQRVTLTVWNHYLFKKRRYTISNCTQTSFVSESLFVVQFVQLMSVSSFPFLLPHLFLCEVLLFQHFDGFYDLKMFATFSYIITLFIHQPLMWAIFEDLVPTSQWKLSDKTVEEPFLDQSSRSHALL